MKQVKKKITGRGRKKGQGATRNRGTERRQLAFVTEYLKDYNATQAAIRAGYSPHSAHSSGYMLLKNASIQALIQQHMERNAQQMGITREAVLEELRRVGFANMADYMTWDGATAFLKPSDQLSREQTAAIASIQADLTPGGALKFKMHDKIAALEKLGRHLGLFPTTKVGILNGAGGTIVETDAVVIYLPDNHRPVVLDAVAERSA